MKSPPQVPDLCISKEFVFGIPSFDAEAKQQMIADGLTSQEQRDLQQLLEDYAKTSAMLAAAFEQRDQIDQIHRGQRTLNDGLLAGLYQYLQGKDALEMQAENEAALAAQVAEQAKQKWQESAAAAKTARAEYEQGVREQHTAYKAMAKQQVGENSTAINKARSAVRQILNHPLAWYLEHGKVLDRTGERLLKYPSYDKVSCCPYQRSWQLQNTNTLTDHNH